MKMRTGRRMISLTLAIVAVVSMLLVNCAPAGEGAPAEEEPVAEPGPKTITAKIGFNAPLSGEAAAWGLPGLYGCEIWAEWNNEAGGFELPDGTRVLVDMIPYDNEYIADKALAGAKKLVLQDKVVLVNHMAGAPLQACVPFYTEHEMIATTQMTDDLAPDNPYVLACGEVYPLHHVPAFTWLLDHSPDIKRFAMTAQNDEIGITGMACLGALAEAAGLDIVYEEMFDPTTTDFAPIASAILAKDPDLISTTSCYPTFVNLLLEQLYLQGYDGHLEGTTLDMYQDIIEKTSVDFIDGYCFDFPDFDDPALTPEQNEFYYEYIERHPGEWSAVSWEYATILDTWQWAAQKANSIEPMPVLEALKSEGKAPHAFGMGFWWGTPMYGSDNMLCPKWPAVCMENGKAVIKEFGDMVGWWYEGNNKEIWIKWHEKYGIMWYQKLGVPKQTAIDEYELLEDREWPPEPYEQ